MNFKQLIAPNGDAFFMGTDDTMEECQGDTSVRVAFPMNIDFMILELDEPNFTTSGPVGGSNVPYDCIQWAYENAPGFGVSIETLGGKNCPIIWLPSGEWADQMLANLNAQVLAAR
jgi:hypothetical protein